jgi:hypothetical protein
VAPNIGVKEMVALSAIILQIALITTALSIRDLDEVVDPDISLEVSRTVIEKGQYGNLTPVEGKMWQIVYVNVTNNNDRYPHDVPYWAFYGYTESGERIWTFNSDEPSIAPIEPGENAIIELVFDIPMDTRLIQLEYVQSMTGPLVIDISSHS